MTKVTQTPDESRPAPTLRIGDAERNAAVDALSEHLSAGRITLSEFSERSASASAAQNRDELIGLFDDLPQPRPAGYPAGQSLAATAGSSVSTPVADAATPSVPTSRNRKIYYATVAALPILCTIIFALSDWTWWYIYLLIPLVGAVGNSLTNDGDECQTDRDRRREVNG